MKRTRRGWEEVKATRARWRSQGTYRNAFPTNGRHKLRISWESIKMGSPRRLAARPGPVYCRVGLHHPYGPQGTKHRFTSLSNLLFPEIPSCPVGGRVKALFFLISIKITWAKDPVISKPDGNHPRQTYFQRYLMLTSYPPSPDPP